MNEQPHIKDVLLVGGGHSHVLLIRQWAMQPLPGVRLTLVSQSVMTPYSGMLPGLVAGHYSVDDVHIDLARVCSWAGVRFIEAAVTALDLGKRMVLLDIDRPAIEFDVLSLDTGSTPELAVDGAAEHSIPVKPVYNFHERWLQFIERQGASSKPLSLGVVGSGAGGFELVMAMRHALADKPVQCHWFLRRDLPISGRPRRVGELALQAAKDSGVTIHQQFDVVKVHKRGVDAADGRHIELDDVFWCASAIGPDWPAQSGLQTDRRGFVATTSTLQSASHPFVFATGDIGTQIDTPSAKAGVFAVRQAPVLFRNIRHYLLGRALSDYKPQTDFLSLMATGGKSAIASRGPLAVSAAWVWRWKDHIDRKFMRQFQQLEPMTRPSRVLQVPSQLLEGSSVSRKDIAVDAMRCHGCGAKVGASILHSVLSELAPLSRDDVISGIGDAADTAQLRLPQGVLVQSVDQVSAVCDDPYLFGRIAAAHAISDVLTESCELHSAQVLLTLPFADDALLRRDLLQLMSGINDVLRVDGCALVGGHTAEGAQLQAGLVVNAMKSSIGAQRSANTGDAIILTKPIGSGVLLAAHQQQLARGPDVQKLYTSMQTSNRMAAQVLHDAGAAAITDITGFGLLAHLRQRLKREQLGAAIHSAAVPLFNGASRLAQQGVGSTLLAHNRTVLQHVSVSDAVPDYLCDLMCDPQTSGGLAGVVAASQADEVIARLHAAGVDSATVIGEVIAASKFTVD